MKKESGIYKITNLITNDFYIGQSIDLYMRKKHHFSELHYNKHHNIHLQRAWNKYGEDNFKFEVLLYCEPFELTRYEQFFVDKFSPVYNICKECVDSNQGIKYTEESKINLSISHKGYKASKEAIENNRLSHIGKFHTEETKLKLSLAHKGRRSNFFGHKHTQESKLKMSVSKKGKPNHAVSEETRLKISISIKKYWDEKYKKERVNG